MTHATDFNLTNLLLTGNANVNLQNLNTSIDEPENRCNIHLESYDTLTYRAKLSCNGWLSHCSWTFWIFNESYRWRTKNSVGWRIATNARIGFKLQVNAIPGFHSLYDWCYQTMWLFSGVPEDPEDETVMEMHGANALYSAVKSLMHAISTEDEDAQQDTAHRIIQIAMPWTMRRWSDWKLANGRPLVRIPKKIAFVFDSKWTDAKEAKLKTLVERHTRHGASGAWRMPRWRLTCISLVLGDTKDRNDVSGHWYDEWPIDTSVDSPIFRWLWDAFLPILVKDPAEYPEPDENEESNEALLQKPESNQSSLLPAPLPQKAGLYCTLPNLVRHLKWWLTKFFADHLDIF